MFNAIYIKKTKLNEQNLKQISDVTLRSFNHYKTFIYDKIAYTDKTKRQLTKN